MKRFIAVLAVAGACLGMAVTVMPSGASAKSHVAVQQVRATGPFFLKTANANVCVAVTPDQPGAIPLQGDYNTRHCRKLFFDQRGHVSGFPYGQWLTTGGNALASVDCAHVDLAAAQSTGTSWVTFISGRATYLVNKRCDEQHEHSNCLDVLAASGTVGREWNVINRLSTPGFFASMRIVSVSVPRAGRSARAGC